MSVHPVVLRYEMLLISDNENYGAQFTLPVPEEDTFSRYLGINRTLDIVSISGLSGSLGGAVLSARQNDYKTIPRPTS